MSCLEAIAQNLGDPGAVLRACQGQGDAMVAQASGVDNWRPLFLTGSLAALLAVVGLIGLLLVARSLR